MTDGAVARKFADNVGSSLPAEQVRRVEQLVHGAESLADIGELVEACIA
ncbi:MAG: hypothetical protein QM733_09600 [Ilumatobacteraceae bacterium]